MTDREAFMAWVDATIGWPETAPEIPLMWGAWQAATQAQAEEIKRLKTAIKRTHYAKGRYHSQIAMCDLYDAAGLPNVRPTKDKP